MELRKREEIDTELTWNLNDIFATEEAYETALAQLEQDANDFIAAYKGTLATADDAQVLTMLDQYDQLLQLSSRVGSYAGLRVQVDHTNQANVRRSLVMQSKLTAIFAELSFVQSELLALSDAQLARLRDSVFGAYIAALLRDKPHRFSPETEKVLSGLSILSELPYRTYETAKLGDLVFPSFTVDGKTYPLSYSLYETGYAEHKNTAVRRTAFDAFYDQIATQRQTIAAGYYTEVAAQKALADLRGYESVFDMLLQNQEVSMDLYDRQIDGLMQGLAPVMRRYAEKLKKNHNLATITYADLRLPASFDVDRSVTIDKAWDMVESALAIMGDDYLAIVKRARTERWVDFAQNIGKSTGGFCAGVSGIHPYILMNWNGSFSEVFTLAHELGHACQGMIAEAHNRRLQEDPSLYFIEAPSTIHELLLTNDLLAKDPSAETARAVAGQMVDKTYFHNCVTHLLEAAFQRDVYRAIERGESLSADDFDRYFLDVLKTFWGETVDIPDKAGRTWMRQPHYYMGLYPYTYSAGLVVSTAVSKNIREQGQAAVTAWIETLRRGGSLPPVELARVAGVDLTTKAPLNTMIQTISELVDRI